MDQRSRQIRLVATSGIVANIFLLVIKLTVGLMSRSEAMIADGLNSAGDVFASLMTYIGNKISSQPDDENHPYGHGKAEYIFSMIISFSLLLVAAGIIKNSFEAFEQEHHFIFTPWLLVVAVITIILKFFLYRFSNRIGLKYNSLLAIANAQDHRNDVFVTSLTLLSAVTAYFNFYIVDAIIGILIGLWIGYTGVTIFSEAYFVLMDTTLEESIKETMINDIAKIEGVDHVDAITSKPIGPNFLLIVKISIDGNMSILKGHAIGEHVKETLMAYKNIEDVIVHLNATQIHPHINKLR